MKALDELDHYEVLEIPRSAERDDVERAYRMAYAAYGAESLALYSIFDSKDAELMRERIDLAYRVLREEESRREYDAALLERGETRGDVEAPGPAAIDTGRAVEDAIAATEGLDPQPVLEDLEAQAEEESEALGGASLRRARLRRGVDLDHVADVTKISASYLRFLEQESFDDLPAPVYVRGFVSAYARTLGLDGERVASGYMARLEEANQVGRRRGRLLGGK